MSRRVVHNMPRPSQNWLIGGLLLVLLLNTVVIGRALNLYKLPGEQDDLHKAKEGAQLLVGYVERLAKDQGLGSLATVKDLVARLQYDVQRARSLDELSQVVMTGSSMAKEILDMELDGKRREVLQSLIGGDPNVSTIKEKITVTVSNDQGNGVSIDDAAEVLTAVTIAAINQHPLMSSAFDSIVIEINDGKARVINYRTLYDRLKVLQQEAQDLQAELRQVRSLAGYASLTGAGIIVKMYDALGGYTNDYIVHDADVRDLINEMLAAGAVGVAVGNQRLTAISSIRCAGSVILVNQKQIAVNPVVIHAVGEPEVLESSLDLIKNTLEATKGIRIVVERAQQLTLPAAVMKP